MAMNHKRGPWFGIAGLLFAVSGLLWVLARNIPIGMMNVCVGMMLITIGSMVRRNGGDPAGDPPSPTANEVEQHDTERGDG